MKTKTAFKTQVVKKWSAPLLHGTGMNSMMIYIERKYNL